MKKQLFITLTLALAQNALCMEAPEKAEESPSGNLVLQTNLLHALENRFYSSASQLINARVKLTKVMIDQLQDTEVGKKILKIAIDEGHVHTINVLIAYGAFPKESGQYHFNCFVRYLDYISYQKDLLTLMRSNARDVLEINGLHEIPETTTKVTPLGNAAALGLLPLVQAFLEAKNIDPNIKDSLSNTPLINVIDYSNHPDVKVINALLSHPRINVNTTGAGERTALHSASQRCNIDAAKLLYAKGANINAQNKDGRTALIIALLNNDYEFVRWLLSLKPDLILKDNVGLTAFQYAKFSPNHKIQALPELLK